MLARESELDNFHEKIKELNANRTKIETSQKSRETSNPIGAVISELVGAVT